MIEEQIQETPDDSWANIFDVIYAFYGDRIEEAKDGVEQIHEVISASPVLGDEFNQRFLGQEQWNLEEKLFLATALLESRPYAENITLCASLLDACIQRSEYFNSLFHCICQSMPRVDLSCDDFDTERFKELELWPRYSRFLEHHFSSFEFPPGEDIQAQDARVALVIPQFIGGPHRPSAVALAYARTLNLGLERHVLLANSEALPQRQEAPINGGGIVDRHPDSDQDIIRFQHLGADMIYWRANDVAFSVQKIKAAALIVDAFNPGCVFSMGDWNMVADVLARKYPVVHVPSGPGSAMSLGHVLLHSTADKTACRLDHHVGELHQTDFMPVDAESPEGMARRRLGIPPKAIVFAVGAEAVSEELDANMDRIVESLITTHRKAVVVVVGADDTRRFTKSLPKKCSRRVMAFGTSQDVLSLLHSCDVYLSPLAQENTDRAFLAMRAGLAIVSLNEGQVGQQLGQAQCVTSIEEYQARIHALAESQETLEEARIAIRDVAQRTPAIFEVPEALEAICKHALAVFEASASTSRALDGLANIAS